MTEVAVITDVTLPAATQRLRRGRMLLISLLADERDDSSTGVPMRCWDARRRVSDYIDEDISERERGLLELHLPGCPTCPPLDAGLVGLREALGRMRDPDDVVPHRVAARIREALQP